MAQGLFTLRQVNQAIRQGAWSAFNPPQFVEYLCVAGGGGGGYPTGGYSGGGGGGAGGLLTGIVPVASGASYFVTVGAGAAARTNGNLQGNSGNASVFDAVSSAAYTGRIVATGGGGGGAGSTTESVQDGISGGSGGGATFNGVGGSGVSGQGNNGTTGSQSNNNGGAGGGGAGNVGSVDTSSGGGNGGAGIASVISGTVTTYAGGGGGGAYTGTGGSGGVGGGGGAVGTDAGRSGAVNTGGGGAGSGASSSPGGGGSGIVVVRYPGNIVFYTGGTVNYNNEYIIHIFNSNGTLAPTAPTVYNTSYQISRSLRFNKTDQAYLERTFSVAGNQKTWTQSLWVKRSSLGTQQDLYSPYYGGDGGNESQAYFNSSDQLAIYDSGGQAGYFAYTTTQVFRDVSAWYHIVFACDTTQATASDRMKIYVNGVQITSFASVQNQTQNTDTGWNDDQLHRIGSYARNTTNTLDGYMAEFHSIDGQALTPSSFGATSTTTGVWAPIQYTGSYGTNGFYLNFSDNTNTTAATLGKDYSGNGNNWTPNNFSVTAGAGNDSMVDVPTSYGFDTGVGGEVRGNYCTLNPLDTQSIVPANGNLNATSFAPNRQIHSTILPSSGKWYAEFTCNASMSDIQIGIANNKGAGYLGETANSWGVISSNGNRIHNAGQSAYGSSYTTNDVVIVALDLDNGKWYAGKNGTWFNSGNPATGTNPAHTGLSGEIGFAIGSNFSGGDIDCNFGQRPFAYTAPSGYKALNTQNLPTPAIGGTSETLANEFFGVTTYTGNSSTQSIVNSGGFQPDWVWLKSRNDAYNHQLFDAVRGVNKTLYANLTNAEFSDTDALTAFNSNGFTLGAEVGINDSPKTYVAWQWKGGGGASRNTAGSLASLVSANPRSGFSIVSYTGTGVTASIGHGLDAVPSMIIVKSRSGSSASHFWPVWHRSVYATNQSGYLNMNSPNGTGSASGVWTTTFPTSAVFSVGGDTSTSASAATYIAYCFAPIEGYSAFGSYTGNGSADGPFVYTGFRPEFILTKDITSSSYWWEMVDSARAPFNPSDKTLYANVADSEYTSSGYNKDLLSNGFKIRGTSGAHNTSASTYIYMAFASNPFKYSLAR